MAALVLSKILLFLFSGLIILLFILGINYLRRVSRLGERALERLRRNDLVKAWEVRSASEIDPMPIHILSGVFNAWRTLMAESVVTEIDGERRLQTSNQAIENFSKRLQFSIRSEIDQTRVIRPTLNTIGIVGTVIGLCGAFFLARPFSSDQNQAFEGLDYFLRASTYAVQVALAALVCGTLHSSFCSWIERRLVLRIYQLESSLRARFILTDPLQNSGVAGDERGLNTAIVATLEEAFRWVEDFRNQNNSLAELVELIKQVEATKGSTFADAVTEQSKALQAVIIDIGQAHKSNTAQVTSGIDSAFQNFHSGQKQQGEMFSSLKLTIEKFAMASRAEAILSDIHQILLGSLASNQESIRLLRGDLQVQQDSIQGSFDKILSRLPIQKLEATTQVQISKKSVAAANKRQEKVSTSEALKIIQSIRDNFQFILKNFTVINDQRSYFEKTCKAFNAKIVELKRDPGNDYRQIIELLESASKSARTIRNKILAIEYIQGHAIEVTIDQLDKLNAKIIITKVKDHEKKYYDTLDHLWKNSAVPKNLQRHRDSLFVALTNLSKIYINAQETILHLSELAEARHPMSLNCAREIEDTVKNLSSNWKRFEYPIWEYGDLFIPELNKLKRLISNSERLFPLDDFALESEKSA